MVTDKDKEAFIWINKTHAGQHAVAVLANRYDFRVDSQPFAVDADTTDMTPEAFFGGISFPGDGSTIIKVLEALLTLLTGLGVNCSPAAGRVTFRQHRRYPLRKAVTRLRLAQWLKGTPAEGDEGELLDLTIARLEIAKDEVIEATIAEMREPGNDLF